MRLLPRSLIGQTLLAAALALVVAQAVSAVLLWRAGDQRREAQLLNTIAFQYVAAPIGSAREERFRDRPNRDMRPMDGQRRSFPRRLRYRIEDASPLAAGDSRDAGREASLATLLDNQGIAVGRLAVAERTLTSDPVIRRAAMRFPRLAERIAEGDVERIVVAGLQRAGSTRWEVVRLPAPRPDQRLIGTIVVQTLLLVLVLTILLWLILRRIARPLAQLAERTQRFAGAGAPEPPLEPSGPQDVRDLVSAHNAMQARIGAMLHEKDVMLGAIGHDLKTPLAALRVRIESVADDTARAKMAATIEDITRTLDDILHLARVGRSDAPVETVEIGALAESVLDEFEELGQPVALETEGRVPAKVRITWLKRGVRNLVSNAVRYGGSAVVSVLRENGQAVLRIEDNGPGIPETRIAEMMEPFARGESSRNRATGGAGLGLAIARAVAEQHGGTLTLANRSEGGLRAEIRLPL